MASDAEEKTLPPHWRWDAAVALVVSLLCAIGCWVYTTANGFLPDTRYGDADMFRPALAIAAGLGLQDVANAPGLEDFVAKRTLEYDLDLLHGPEAHIVPAQPKFTVDRLYLLYAIGWTWRLFGATWPNVYLVNSLFFGLCGTFVYGIFRLGMRPPIALAGAVLTLCSPLMLTMFPAVRDFYKAPFLLGAILFCGWVVKGGMRGRSLLVVSLVAGAFVGIGIGFRQDSTISVPIALLCVLLFHRTNGLGLRVAAAVLFVAGMLAPAMPVLRMNTDTGGNNAFYLNQGFAHDALRLLELNDSSVTPYHTWADGIMHAYIHRYAKHRDYPFMRLSQAKQAAVDWRVPFLAAAQPLGVPTLYRDVERIDAQPMWSRSMEQVARDAFIDVTRFVPADFLARAYGSVLVSLRGMDERSLERSGELDGWVGTLEQARRPVLDHLQRFGLIYVVAAFALIAAKNLWVAVGALVVLLYFLGYPSLLFHARHAFHLAFACWWAPLFLVNACVTAAAHRRDLAREWPRLPLMTVRAAGFVVVVVLALKLPMDGARALQHDQVQSYASQIDPLQLQPVKVAEAEQNEFERIYRPAPGQLFQALERETWWNRVLPVAPYPDIATEYLAAEIQSESVPRVTLRTVDADREMLIELPPGPDSETGTYTVYFPVFAYSDRFSEIVLPNDMYDFDAIFLDNQSELVRLERVTDTSVLGHLMVYWKPRDADALVTAKTVQWWPAS